MSSADEKLRAEAESALERATQRMFPGEYVMPEPWNDAIREVIAVAQAHAAEVQNLADVQRQMRETAERQLEEARNEVEARKINLREHDESHRKIIAERDAEIERLQEELDSWKEDCSIIGGVAEVTERAEKNSIRLVAVMREVAAELRKQCSKPIGDGCSCINNRLAKRLEDAANGNHSESPNSSSANGKAEQPQCTCNQSGNCAACCNAPCAECGQAECRCDFSRCECGYGCPGGAGCRGGDEYAPKPAEPERCNATIVRPDISASCDCEAGHTDSHYEDSRGLPWYDTDKGAKPHTEAKTEDDAPLTLPVVNRVTVKIKPQPVAAPSPAPSEPKRKLFAALGYTPPQVWTLCPQCKLRNVQHDMSGEAAPLCDQCKPHVPADAANGEPKECDTSIWQDRIAHAPTKNTREVRNVIREYVDTVNGEPKPTHAELQKALELSQLPEEVYPGEMRRQWAIAQALANTRNFDVRLNAMHAEAAKLECDKAHLNALIDSITQERDAARAEAEKLRAQLAKIREVLGVVG